MERQDAFSGPEFSVSWFIWKKISCGANWPQGGDISLYNATNNDHQIYTEKRRQRKFCTIYNFQSNCIKVQNLHTPPPTFSISIGRRDECGSVEVWP